MPNTAQELRGLLQVYPHDQLLNAYIQSGSPYSEVVQQYQTYGTSPTSIMSMLINSAETGEPFRFDEGGDFESAIAPEVEQGVFDMTSLLQNIAQIDTTAPGKTGWEQAKEEAREIAGQPRKGLLGKLKTIFDTSATEKYIAGVDTNTEILKSYGQYQDAMRTVGEKVTKPLVVETKKAISNYVRVGAGIHGPRIEADIKQNLAAGKPIEIVKLRNHLMEIGEHGLLPPPDEYSQDFISNLKKNPSYAQFLFLLSEWGSKGSTKGEPEWITDRMLADHPALYALPLGIGIAIDEFMIEEFETPENWHWYAMGWLGAKVAFGPGMRAVAEAAQKGKPYAKFLMWDIGKGFRNFLRNHYDAPLVKKMLAKEMDIPATAVSNYLRGAATDDPFLVDNPIFRDVLARMERENPKYLQELMDFLVKNADDLDNVVYQLAVPRKAAKAVQKQMGPLRGKRPAHQGVLEVIATNEGDDTAGLVAGLWDKGINTLEAAATPSHIRIALEPPTREALLELKAAPFGYMTQIVDDVTEHIIEIPRSQTAKALQYIRRMRQHAKPVWATKTQAAWHRQLDNIMEKGWLDEDDLIRIKDGLIPEEIPSVGAPVTAAGAARQPARPIGDTGRAPSPAGAAAPHLEVGAAAPLTPVQENAWKTPLVKWLRRDLPYDLTRVQKHPARVKGWDLVPDKQIDDYLNRLSRVVRKYTPERAGDFQRAYTQYLSGTGRQTAGSWDDFLQWAHTEYTRAKWLPEMKALGIDDPNVAARQFHEIAVRAALETGKRVPDDVLKAYPNLAIEFADKTAPMTIEAMERMSMQPDAPAPGTIREAAPLKAPHTTATPVNKQSLRQLGWTNAQVSKMDPDEAARAIAEGLAPDKYRISPKGTVDSIVSPGAASVVGDDLAPRSLAVGLLDTLDDETMRVLNTTRMDPRGIEPSDILKTLSESNPQFAGALAKAGEVDPGTILDTMIQVWGEGARGASYLDDMLKQISDDQWESLPERIKARLISLVDRKKGKAPEIEDLGLRAHFAAGNEYADNIYTQTVEGMKHSIEKQISDIDPNRAIRQLHTQFWDDMRTGLQPIAHRSANKSDLTMGIIMGDLKKPQREHLFKILGLRDYLASLSDELEIPGAWTSEVITRELTRQMDAAGPGVMRGVQRYYDVMRVIGDDLVRRGRLSPAALRSNYLPHMVLDYTPDWMLDSNFRPSTPHRIQRAYRRYTKQRAGDTRDIALNPTMLRTHFAMVYADNGMEDWALKHLDGEDLWNAVVKAGMTDDEIKAVRGAVFGVDDAGRVKRPRHGQRFDIDGVDEPFYGFQFEPGNQYYRAEGLNRTALGHAVEDSLLLKPDVAEELASRIDLHNLSKGEIPAALSELIDAAGPRGGSVRRTLIAVGRRHRAYVVPESIYKKMMFYKNQAPVHVPGLYGLMRFTSMWKRLTLGWAGLPFHTSNLAGDTMNLYRTAPGALPEMWGALRMIRNMNRPIGRTSGIFGPMTSFDRYSLDVAVNKAVFDSGFATEYLQTQNVLNPKHWWQRIERLSALRESTTRLAMLRYQLKHFDRYGKWKAPEFSHILYDKAGNALLDKESGAAFIARRFTVDYEAMPEYYNQIIRGTTFPFMTFWHENAKNWTMYALGDPKGFTAKFIAPRVLAHSWNTYMYPDIEAAMGGLRRRGHLNLWKWDANDDGEDDYGLVWAMQTPMDMAAQWLGLDRLEEKVTLVQKGVLSPEEAAKQQGIDMALGAPRLAAKLTSPILQAVRGRLTNKHPFTGQPILTENQLKLSPWQQEKIWRKFYLQQVVTPFGQYMMDQSNQNMDTLEALGIHPKNPLARTILRGPLHPIRGWGIFVVDLKRGDQQWNQYARRAAEQQLATTKEKLYDEYYEFDGKPYEWEKFLSQDRVKQILEDSARLKQDLNLSQIQQLLSTPLIQRRFWQNRAFHAKTNEEYKEAIRNVELLTGVQNLQSLKRAPTPARPALIERREQMK